MNIKRCLSCRKKMLARKGSYCTICKKLIWLSPRELRWAIVEALASLGVSNTSIAALVGLSPKSVWRFVKNLGILCPHKGRPRHHHEKAIIKAYCEGLLITDIAARFDTSRITVWKIARRNNLPHRNKRPHRHAQSA